MAVQYDRRYLDKVDRFVDFVKGIHQKPTLKATDDITHQLGISAVIFSNTAYSAPHCYNLLRICDIQKHPKRNDLYKATVTVWDPIAGFVTFPGDHPFATKRLSSVLIGTSVLSGSMIAPDKRGFVYLPDQTNLDAFDDKNKQLQFKITPPLAKRLKLKLNEELDDLEAQIHLLTSLEENYSMDILPIGPIQDLDEQRYDCLIYTLFYAIHANLRNPRTREEIDVKRLEKFIVAELLE